MATQDPELQIILRDIPTKNRPERTAFRKAVVNALWNRQYTLDEFSQISVKYEAYFILVYEELCRHACTGSAGTSLANITNQELLDIASALCDTALPTRSISQIHDTQDERGKRVVSLAAGLLLPLNFTGKGQAFSGAIDLNFDVPLKEFVTSSFAELLPAIEPDVICLPQTTCATCAETIPAAHRTVEPDSEDVLSLRFSRHFSAYKLQYIAGFKISWTHNLLDHLLLTDTENEVRLQLFHHTKQLGELESLNESAIPNSSN
jgi:hypothetical protein